MVPSSHTSPHTTQKEVSGPQKPTEYAVATLLGSDVVTMHVGKECLSFGLHIAVNMWSTAKMGELLFIELDKRNIHFTLI